MVSIPQNKLLVNTLSPKPGITIWYCKIPDITDSILSTPVQKNFRTVMDKLFQKNNFIKPFFNDEEISAINSFKALKKQIEWISGRVLIKQMLHYFFLKTIPLDQITLSYLEQGAPFVTQRPYIPISLSHSNDYTTAACCKDKGQIIGIDIEKIAKKPDIFFLKTAFTHNEISHLENNTDQIFKNWTIKEAYLKYIKKGFNESLHSVEVINDEIWHNKKKISVDVYSTFIDDYVLSLVSSRI